MIPVLVEDRSCRALNTALCPSSVSNRYLLALEEGKEIILPAA